MINVVINEIPIEVEKGTTILDAATENGIEIPYNQIDVHMK